RSQASAEAGCDSGEPEPVEAVPPEGQQIRQFPDGGEAHPAEQLDRMAPLEGAEIQLGRLREPGEVVDAQDEVVLVLAQEGEDGGVGGGQFGVGAESEGGVLL